MDYIDHFQAERCLHRLLLAPDKRHLPSGLLGPDQICFISSSLTKICYISLLTITLAVVQVITLAQWHTGTIPVLHLLHALLAASYFYM